MSEWLPIESAPTDGSKVLAWRYGWERPIWMGFYQSFSLEKSLWLPEDGRAEVWEKEQPTHWTKLGVYPEPSASERAKVEAEERLEMLRDVLYAFHHQKAKGRDLPRLGEPFVSLIEQALAANGKLEDAVCEERERLSRVIARPT